MKRESGRLRIIGGQWRSRVIAFDADPKIGLRATPDRVRQTLFDWLSPLISGAECLDLFAGSGALGLEALSRGAAHCTFVDAGAQQSRDIRTALHTLKAIDSAEVLTTDALGWLKKATAQRLRFDMVFMDPPYNTELLAQALALLSPLLKPANRLYLEWNGAAPTLPAGFSWLKEKQAGQVSYGLVTYEAATP
jgi:16S rRNA (guanine966-N2)-methyltransferase